MAGPPPAKRSRWDSDSEEEGEDQDGAGAVAAGAAAAGATEAAAAPQQRDQAERALRAAFGGGGSSLVGGESSEDEAATPPPRAEGGGSGDGEAGAAGDASTLDDGKLDEDAAGGGYNPLWYGCRSVDSYDPLNKIDEGTYGVVFRAKERDTGKIWALKQVKISPEMAREGFPHTALRETNILLGLQHDNIVRVREMVVGASMDSIYMVMEYFENDFKKCMKQMQRPFSQAEVKCLLRQLLSAVAYMHRNWYIHRDLKTSNLLYSNSGKLSICDFGLARRYTDPLEPYTQPVVTLFYRCPELLLGERHYGAAVDVWSVGCIFGEFLAREPILLGVEGELDQIDKIFENLGAPNTNELEPNAQTWPGYMDLPVAQRVNWKKYPKNGKLRGRIPKRSSGEGPYIDDDGFDLLIRLLALDPQRRISCEQAMQHVYFKRFPLAAHQEEMPKFHSKNEVAR